MPPIIRVSQGEIDVPSLLTYAEFTYESFTASVGRNPTVTEQGSWVALLAAARATSGSALREQARVLIRGIFEGAEYVALATTDSVFIANLYNAYLGRPAEIGGKTFWMGVLAGSTRGGLMAAFEGSAEFGRRTSEIAGMIHFRSTIRDISAIALSDGNAADNADISIDNLDDFFSTYLGDAGRILYPAPALVMRAYPVGVDGNAYELDVKLVGFATFGKIIKRTAPVTVVSDINRTGYRVGTLDTQRCPAIYKGPGCDTNDATPTCSRIWGDAVNGCASKDPAPILISGGATNNQPSFLGGPDQAVEAAGGAASPDPATDPPNPWPNPGFPDPEDPRLGPGRRGYTPQAYDSL